MADQSVRITNLPDSGSHERVAYDLWSTLRHNLPNAEGKEAIEQMLTLYVACRAATFGSVEVGKLK